MGSNRVEIHTLASPQTCWDAIRDIGALHTRLVPGFVLATELIPGGRRVTFANGVVVTEPIVELDEDSRRLVWTLIGGNTTHYNASVQVFASESGARVVWIADFLPDAAGSAIRGMMTQGAIAMTRALNAAK
jgi:hypothetical protein